MQTRLEPLLLAAMAAGALAARLAGAAEPKPTLEGLFLADYTARTFPERLDDPAWQKDIPRDIAADIPTPPGASCTPGSSSA